MSRALEVRSAACVAAMFFAATACSSDGDPNGAGGGTGGGVGGTASAAGNGSSTAGVGTLGGSSSTGGNNSNPGTAGSGTAGSGTAGSGTAGSSTGGSGTAGSPSSDCSVAPPDECPMPTGIEIACKKRFALGINYAWRNFGADFGGLAAWNIKGVAAAAADYGADLSAMKGNGASVIRWWLFPDFRGDGVQFDGNDDPSGLTATTLADMAKALELAQQANVYLVPTLFSFDAFRPTSTVENVVVRGITGIVNTPARRAKLMQNVVQPLARAAATSPHAARLAGWDIINEPEWAIEPTGQNAQDFEPNEELDAVSLSDMKAFIREAAAVLERETPAAFTSVGWAAAKWSWAFADVELDVNQPHIYAWVNQYWPYTQTPAQLGYPASRPTIMGEFSLHAMPFVGENGGGVTDSFSMVLESWWSNGYAGAWPWQHFDQAANLPLIKAFADAKGCPAKP